MARYTDRDRAAVLAELTANEGNVKRTARTLNMPISTVRAWRDQWERRGVPQEVTAEVSLAVTDFLTDAKRIRNKLLARLEGLIDSDKTQLRDVSTAIGILSDKIRAYEAVGESKKVEHSFILPEPDELRQLMMSAVEGVVDAAQKRAAELAFIEQEPILDSANADVLELLPG